MPSPTTLGAYTMHNQEIMSQRSVAVVDQSGKTAISERRQFFKEEGLLTKFQDQQSHHLLSRLADPARVSIILGSEESLPLSAWIADLNSEDSLSIRGPTFQKIDEDRSNLKLSSPQRPPL